MDEKQKINAEEVGPVEEGLGAKDPLFQLKLKTEAQAHEHDSCFVCGKYRWQHLKSKLCKASVAALEAAIGTSKEPWVLPNGDAILRTKAGVAKLNEQLDAQHNAELTIDSLAKQLAELQAKRNTALPSVGNPSFREDCFALCAQLQETERQVLQVFHEHPVFHDKIVDPALGLVEAQRSEMRANLMLARRHLEDARTRIGKALETYDGTSYHPK